MEVYTAAADNYMNLDLDKPVTYSIILDTDRKIILWRWKVDQVKEVFTTPEDRRRSAEKG